MRVDQYRRACYLVVVSASLMILRQYTDNPNVLFERSGKKNEFILCALFLHGNFFRDVTIGNVEESKKTWRHNWSLTNDELRSNKTTRELNKNYQPVRKRIWINWVRIILTLPENKLPFLSQLPGLLYCMQYPNDRFFQYHSGKIPSLQVQRRNRGHHFETLDLNCHQNILNNEYLIKSVVGSYQRSRIINVYNCIWTVYDASIIKIINTTINFF